MHTSLKIGLLVGGSLALGVLSYYIFSGWFNILPWILAGLMVGYFNERRDLALRRGALYGYFLFLSYIIVGYQGKSDPFSLFKFGLFAILFSFLGGVAGAMGGWLGNWVRRRTKGPEQDSASTRPRD